MFSKKPLFFHAKMNQKTPWTRRGLGTDFREGLGEEENRPRFALATKQFRAIRVVRAMRAVRVLGAGLGFPVGDSAPLRFHPQPPIWLHI